LSYNVNFYKKQVHGVLYSELHCNSGTSFIKFNIKNGNKPTPFFYHMVFKSAHVPTAEDTSHIILDCRLLYKDMSSGCTNLKTRYVYILCYLMILDMKFY